MLGNLHSKQKLPYKNMAYRLPICYIFIIITIKWWYICSIFNTHAGKATHYTETQYSAITNHKAIWFDLWLWIKWILIIILPSDESWICTLAILSWYQWCMYQLWRYAKLWTCRLSESIPWIRNRVKKLTFNYDTCRCWSTL